MAECLLKRTPRPDVYRCDHRHAMFGAIARNGSVATMEWWMGQFETDPVMLLDVDYFHGGWSLFQHLCDDGRLEMLVYLAEKLKLPRKGDIFYHSQLNKSIEHSTQNGHTDVVKWIQQRFDVENDVFQ